MYMFRRFQLGFILALLLAMPLQSAEASFVGNALAKARKVMQSAFQMTFLPHLPVVFHKESFNQMFDHTQKSIDEIRLEHQGQTISRDQFQDDKALHIKKSAELALHIKSLIGSAHLAYGITMVVGLMKEAIDSSFLNPNGSRSKEDVVADHVGAMAVFGQSKYDSSLQKNLGTFIKPGPTVRQDSVQEANFKAETQPEATAAKQFNLPASSAETALPNNAAQLRQQLLKNYYQAAERADSQEMQRLSVELQRLQNR
ncbi:MAG: hypothetical protein ACQETH_15970 [Candidatus Rifleibacteriota bacterium]